MTPAGTVVFWISDGDDAIDQCKEYARDKGLAPSTARIVKREDAVMVILKEASGLK